MIAPDIQWLVPHMVFLYSFDNDRPKLNNFCISNLYSVVLFVCIFQTAVPLFNQQSSRNYSRTKP